MQPNLDRYYKVLGLPITANAAEIKKRYRTLVFLHHPDKNGGNETQFIAITEAYEILSGKKSAPISPSTIVTSRSSSTVAQKTKEERIKEAQQRYKEQVYNEYVENDRYFKQLTSGWKWKIIRLNSIFGVFIALLFFIEPFLPKHYEDAKVTRYSLQGYTSMHDTRASLIVLDTSEELFIENINANLYGSYVDVYVERSWFMHNPLRILSIHPSYLEPFNVEFSLGAYNIFFGLVLLLPLITLLYKKRTITFTLLYHLSLYPILGFILYILLTNDRWAHIITLGFL